MVAPSAGDVVLVHFPFSDLSQAKLRPAVCLAASGRGDFILGQITSNPYGDPLAVRLINADFAAGGLKVASYARPGKLFTASGEIMTSIVGTLDSAKLDEILDAVVAVLRPSP